MRAPGILERRAVFDVDGTGSYGGGGDHAGNSYDGGGGGGGDAPSSSGGDYGGKDEGARATDAAAAAAPGSGPYGAGLSDLTAYDGPLAGIVGEKAMPSYAEDRTIFGAFADYFGAKLGDARARPAETAINTGVGMVPGVGLVNSLLGVLGLPTVGSTVTGTARDMAALNGPPAPSVTDRDTDAGSGPYGPYGGSRGLTFAGGPYAGRDLQASQARSDPLPGFLPDGPASPNAYRLDLSALEAAAEPGGALPGSSAGASQAPTAGGLPLGPLAAAAILAAGLAFG